MSDTVIKIENLRKQYTLGTIGGQTLNAALQSWWARKRGKEDPNLKLGQNYSNVGETFWALDGINLEVKKGEALGIIGGNGAGKSTLLKILSRVTAPTEGDIWIKGRISSMLEVGTGFHPEMTGRENIYMNGAILGMTKKEVDEKIESIIDFSECREFIDTPVKRYSSGMYVKLAFAVASHLDSEIMVMDEVLAVGDMKFQKKCLGKMGDASQNEGKTVLYVSHNMGTIRSLCTRCIVLEKGHLIYDGDVEKAIGIYLGSDSAALYSEYDLYDALRPKSEFGKFFRIDKVIFNRQSPIYYSNEKVIFTIKYSCVKKYENIRFFIHLFDSNTGAPVSLVTSNILITHNGSCTLSLDVSSLSAGNYYFELGVMQIIGNGEHETYDRVSTKISFQITRDNMGDLPIWENSIYGNVIMPHMEEICS